MYTVIIIRMESSAFKIEARERSCGRACSRNVIKTVPQRRNLGGTVSERA